MPQKRNETEVGKGYARKTRSWSDITSHGGHLYFLALDRDPLNKDRTDKGQCTHSDSNIEGLSDGSVVSNQYLVEIRPSHNRAQHSSTGRDELSGILIRGIN